MEVFTEDKLIAILEPSKTDYIKIEAVPENNLPLTTSKFLGIPYIPQGFEYPTNAKGQPLALLAQINFAETPRLQDFPNEGILQFYILPTDDLYGINFYNLLDQNNFRVIYHAEVDENKIEPELPFFDMFLEDWYLPITAEHKLTFSFASEYVSAEDFRFKHFFGSDYFDFTNQNPNDELWGKYSEMVTSSGHKIGGYAFFTQADPRDENFEDYILLLQIDSVSEYICWGDVGVGAFFITKEDLIKRDFSKVLYNWDCT